MRHSPLMAMTCCSVGEDDVILRPSVLTRRFRLLVVPSGPDGR